MDGVEQPVRASGRVNQDNIKPGVKDAWVGNEKFHFVVRYLLSKKKLGKTVRSEFTLFT